MEFLSGMLLGLIMGIAIMCLCQMAKELDEEELEIDVEEEKK